MYFRVGPTSNEKPVPSASEVGGSEFALGQPPNREIVSFRVVRARVVGCRVRTEEKSDPARFSLFPFGGGLFPFSLVMSPAFPFPSEKCEQGEAMWEM